MKHPLLLSAALIGLAACEPAPAEHKAAAPKAPSTATPAPQRAPAVTPLVATGPAAPVQPVTEPDIQSAASVIKLNVLTRQQENTVKLFGTGGGDPAMNGLQTYIAFYANPDAGWAVFPIGDILDYRILSEAPRRVDLEVEESVMNMETTVISSRKRRLIITWSAGAEPEAPASVSITPAR